jgi:L-asparaginase/Glu-tRNA(Gln) amidotransferase subunit D
MQELVKIYDGVIWTQGSPQMEESAYWFNLLIDTTKPICGNSAQRPQGQISADGPANIVSSVAFIESGVWKDAAGKNRCGVVGIQEQQIFAAREIAKADARPGGYVATGGHGGIIGNISHTGRIALTYLPAYKHTYLSELNMTKLPKSVKAAKKGANGIELVDVAVKDGDGKLLGSAIPVVTISTDGSYSGMDFGDDPSLELDLIASIEHKLSLGMLTGFVIQGLVPYGTTPSQARHKLMLKAAYAGIPVCKVGRGAPEGFADPTDFQIAASNLTSTKAGLLMMACLLKLGSLPPAKNPDAPTKAELDAIKAKVAEYQKIFDTH